MLTIQRRPAAKQYADKPVLVGEDEQNNTGSKTDFSDFIGSTKSATGCLGSRQTSLNTTIVGNTGISLMESHRKL
jgi:hypothetical protein